MKIITDWRELRTIATENPLYQTIFDFIFQAIEQPNEEHYIDHWMHSSLIVLDEQQDKHLLSNLNQTDFIHTFPDNYQHHIAYLLNYPEFTEILPPHHYLSLAIWEDYGSGIFLVFDKTFKTDNPILQRLVEESLK